MVLNLLIPAILLHFACADENYGTFVGQFNIYHHGISGSIYAVNSTSLFIKDFNYDGTAKDAFFWGGPGSRPGPQGFIIPYQGRTNVLRKFEGESFVLTLPDGKVLSDLKWLSVYELTKLENFADVYIPDGFEPPKVERLTSFISDDISCDYIEILDFKTIKLIGFSYPGDEAAYFYVGSGHTPSTRGGFIIPDENGYFEPLHPYSNEDLVLTLPGETTIDKIDYFSVFDLSSEKALAYINIPTGLNVPPSLKQIKKYDYSYGNCEELHRDFHVSWEVVGQTINLEIVALMEENEYAAFGLSGSNSSAKMIGSDVAIGFLKQSQVFVHDYNMESKATCTAILEHHKGVCRDSDLGKSDSVQALEGKKIGDLTMIKYRRQLVKNEDMDQSYTPGEQNSIIWAIGPMIEERAAYHRLFPKQLKQIDFGRKEDSKCSPFVLGWRTEIKPWEPFKIVDTKLRSFNAKLGPSAGKRRGSMSGPGISWYIQGLIAPELFLQRGITYSFKVEGGNNPHDLQFYHPFIIAPEAIGGPNEKLYLAGVEITRRGTRRPTTAGRLCIWKHIKDSRLDESYPNFERFRNSLKMRCEQGDPSILEVTPNSSWPDVVYYNSYNGLFMGGKIHILDSFTANTIASLSESGQSIILPFMTMTRLTICSSLVYLFISVIM